MAPTVKWPSHAIYGIQQVASFDGSLNSPSLPTILRFYEYRLHLPHQSKRAIALTQLRFPRNNGHLAASPQLHRQPLFLVIRLRCPTGFIARDAPPLASMGLATGVVAYAFNQRANFYSAMILVNLVLLVYASFVWGLQRLCYGPLRPVEIEQLYEKAWFAVTETCLAMTIFREEVGAWFLVMFTALVTGKVWEWIGEGRVEVLEQQPPANPRLFHTRLSISLLLSVAYDTWLFSYAVHAVIQQARPNMMVMFLFEFAILATCSSRTACRYLLSLIEADITKKQTQTRLEERRRLVREQRNDILRRRESDDVAEAETARQEELPDEDDIDEMDIEVPGWETKGHWILSLDLMTDFVKLGIYSVFFAILMMFYGLPIHIMRDLFMTARSFLKRLGALMRYRKALQDMNKYPDATQEDLTREDTCIICREEMRPWDPSAVGAVERSRPKKLPCGHILHFGCLKGWLERQQARMVLLQHPGKKMPGRMGNERVTVQNLRVLKVDNKLGVVVVKGHVAGPKGCIVKISDAIKKDPPVETFIEKMRRLTLERNEGHEERLEQARVAHLDFKEMRKRLQLGDSPVLRAA
ncbi:hypothetical protein EKO27_g7070 [Xylaria grammica]|uniref:RING-type E3 ubiquitin transferase n=1 Tax=Xylaria grammica TaxID=363999 RepID=A0A439D0R4_9PEZI|nr:hypothetical protein EKO27_g7070 [Xylaria grammica]